MWKTISLIVIAVLLYPVFLELYEIWKNWVRDKIKKVEQKINK